MDYPHQTTQPTRESIDLVGSLLIYPFIIGIAAGAWGVTTEFVATTSLRLLGAGYLFNADSVHGNDKEISTGAFAIPAWLISTLYSVYQVRKSGACASSIQRSEMAIPLRDNASMDHPIGSNPLNKCKTASTATGSIMMLTLLASVTKYLLSKGESGLINSMGLFAIGLAATSSMLLVLGLTALLIYKCKQNYCSSHVVSDQNILQLSARA